MQPKSLIFSSIVAELALMAVILLFLPMLNGAVVGQGALTGHISVYSCGATRQKLLLMIPNILVLVTNIVILVFATLSMFTAGQVIRSTKAAKAFGIIVIVSGSFGILVAVVQALAYILLAKTYAVIAFPVLASVLLVMASLNLHVVQKAAKQAAM